MTGNLFTGPLAAALVARRRRTILRAFRRAGATSEATAISLEELGLSRRPLLRIQQWRGVLAESAPGRFFLDEDRERQVSRLRRVLLLCLVIGTALLATTVVLLFRT